jgi:hypothetical protein
VFSVRSVPRCYNQDKLVESVGELDNRWGSAVVSGGCEELVVEAGDSLRAQRKGNVRCWKPLQSNG